MTGNHQGRAIGFIGLGRMGSRIAANLAAGGHDLCVWNRTPSAAHDWVSIHGGRVAEGLEELARSNELIVTMLAHGEALMDVYMSDLASGIHADTVAIDMGTSGPEAFGTARAIVESHGGTMIDAPVSGATAAAENRTLLVMVGADPETYAEVEPVLASAGRPMHVGPVGSGAVLKLAVNAVLYGINQAVAEATAFAEKAGVEPSTTIEVLTNSAAAAPMIAYRRAQYLTPDIAPIMFTLDLAHKDLELAVSYAREHGVKVAQTERTLEITKDLLADGFGGHDMGYVVEASRSGRA